MTRMKNTHRITLMLTLAFAGCAAEVGSVEESLSRGGEGFWTGTVHSASSTEEPWSAGMRSNLDLFDAGDGTFRGRWYQGKTWTPIRATVDGERFVLRGEGVSGECQEVEVGTLSCRVTTPGGNQATELTEFSPEFGVGAPTLPEGGSIRCPPGTRPCWEECCDLNTMGCAPQGLCYWLDPVDGGQEPRETEGTR